jgi:cytochrome b6-f complex iron-sulfur subunit
VTHNHAHQDDPHALDAHAPGGSQRDSRRDFCRACIGGATVVTIGTVVYPLVAFMRLPATLGAGKPVEIELDRLVVGQAYYADFQGRQIIVLMSEEGPRVFDAACTHLGCNVVWETAQGHFHCPCHGALFSGEGRVVSGPVSAPLREVPFEISEGMLIVA